MQCVEGIKMFMVDNFYWFGRKSDIWADDVLQSNDRFEDSDEFLTDLSIGTNNKDSHWLKDNYLSML